MTVISRHNESLQLKEEARNISNGYIICISNTHP